MWDWDAGDDDVPQIIEIKELRKLFCHWCKFNSNNEGFILFKLRNWFQNLSWWTNLKEESRLSQLDIVRNINTWPWDPYPYNDVVVNKERYPIRWRLIRFFHSYFHACSHVNRSFSFGGICFVIWWGSGRGRLPVLETARALAPTLFTYLLLSS